MQVKGRVSRLAEVMDRLLQLLPLLREKYGVLELGVFGSYTRGEEKQDSDLDLLVEFEKEPSLWEFMELEEFLSERLGVRVEIVSKKVLHSRPAIGENIFSSYLPVREDWQNFTDRAMQGRKRSYEDYLRDILREIDFIKRHTEGVDLDDFLSNDLLTHAITRALEIIGEAAKNLPEELLREYPEVDWKKVKGMRDRLAQAYFGVDYSVVWRVVKEELPALQRVVARMLENTLTSGNSGHADA